VKPSGNWKQNLSDFQNSQYARVADLSSRAAAMKNNGYAEMNECSSQALACHRPFELRDHEHQSRTSVGSVSRAASIDNYSLV
jgi:hypothetical protein